MSPVVPAAPEHWRSSDTIRVPLAGRVRELARLAQHLTGEGPPLLLLVGEPGIGKSRLLEEAAAQASGQGWTVLTSGCHRQNGQAPYSPLLGALAGFLHRQPPVHRQVSLQGCAWMVRLLPELAEERLLPSVPCKLPPEQERRLMFAAVERFLTNIAGPAGTLLVLDDLQWAGADAVDLLAALIRSAAQTPVRVLGSCRSTELRATDPLATLVTDLATSGLATPLELSPLAPADAAALLHNLLGEGREPEELSTQILRRAGGVPFFLVSCAQTLRQHLLSGKAPDEIPWTVAQSIRQRVTALPVAARDLLGIAAVIGRQIPGILLMALATTAGEQTLEALDALSQARLLVSDGDATYQFAHDVIREVVEEDVGALRRKVFHRRVAQALEDAAEEGLVGQLAYHYAQSAEWEKALLYLERAGDQALSLHANAEAEGYYREVAQRLERMGRQEAAGAAWEKLGGVLRLLAKHDQALEAYEQAITLYRVLGDQERLGRATAQLGWVHARRGTPEVGLARVQPFLASLRESECSTHNLATLELVVAELCLVTGRYHEQLQAAERAGTLAQALQEQPVVAQAESRQGTAYFYLGQSENARQHLEHAIQVAQQTGDLWSLCRAWNCLSMVYQYWGAFEQATSSSERALEAAEHLGDPTAIAYLETVAGDTSYYLGHWDRARRYFEHAAELMNQVGASWVSPYPLLSLGSLALAEGQGERATQWLTEAITRAEGMGELLALRSAHRSLAEWELLDGRPQASLARLTPLLDRSEQQETHVTLLLPLLAWAYLELGELEEAQHWSREGIRRAGAGSYQLVLVEALRIQGLLLARQERRQEAEQVFAESLSMSRAMPSPYAEVKTLYASGQLARRHGEAETARERMEAALAICVRLGERLYAQHIEAELVVITRKETHVYTDTQMKISC
jgi:tetratricopeptide (TPR) repeat protein